MGRAELRLPNLIIGGVHKAGTTSLFTYLAQHDEICGSSIKETSYFTPLRYGRNLAPLENYARYFAACQAQHYRMEASAGYLYANPEMLAAVQQTLPELKVLFILREPVERLVSYYRHLDSKMLLPAEDSFEEFVGKSIDTLEKSHTPQQEEDYYVRGVKEGFYADYLSQWHDAFPQSVKVIFFDKLQADPLGVMQDLCSWLDIDPSFYAQCEFTVENRTAHYKNGLLHRAALTTNYYLESFFRKNHGLKKRLRAMYYGINEKKKAKAPIEQEVLDKLQEVYAPHNERLNQFLISKGHGPLPKWLEVDALA